MARTEGLRFLVAFFVGGVLAAIPLGLVLALVSGFIHSGLSKPSDTALIGALLILGILDLIDRTPMRDRQTPQTWIGQMDGHPFGLGLMYGVDVGLLVTTQMATSLVWASLAVAIFLGPSIALVAPLLINALHAVAVAVNAAVGDTSRWGNSGTSRMMLVHRFGRVGAGLLLIGAAGSLLLVDVAA